MSDAKTPLIGRLAVHYKLVTADQLAEALAEEGEPSRLGARLVAMGWIQQGQLERLEKIQRDMLIKHRATQAAQGAAPSAAGAPAGPGPAAGRVPSRPVAERPVRSGALPAADDREGEETPPSTAPKPAAPAAGPARTAAATPGVSAGTTARPAGSEGRKESLHALLRQAVEAQASDLHVHAGAPLRLRIHGELEARGDVPLDAADCEAMLSDALDAEQWERLCCHGQVDFAYDVEGVGRFRANVYRQQRGMDGAFRVIPATPPTLEHLGLPDTLSRFTGYHQGMVLVTGPAGCGKSATMSALVDMVNGSREEHIITVEDPIETIHRSRSCLVNQRQVGPHTETFARALRAALREDPDIIAIGELRDLETISLALTAAETGHFVMATLHTNSAIRTINRLIGVFPPNQQSQIRTMVSESLRAVISQRLVRRADGSGRVPALEILMVNKAVGNLIRENKTVQIGSVLQTGAAQGMCVLDDSLQRLVADGTVIREEARRHCDDPRRFGGAE